MTTLPKNPFENLFDKQSAPSQKTQSNTPQNPFEGLFSAPQETQTPGVVSTERKEYLSAAPAGTIKQEETKKEGVFTKMAKAVLPKKLEDFFGLNENPAVEKVKSSYEQAYAYKDLERLQKEMEAGGGKLPKQTAAGVVSETKPEKYLPFVSAIPDIVNYIQVYQSAKRLEKGEETMVDIYRLTKFKAEMERDKTFGAQVASVLTELPSFGSELLITGGLYTAGKEATEKVVSKAAQNLLGKKLGSVAAKSAGAIIGGTLQTIPARALEITAGTIENMIPDYQFTKDELNNLRPVITGEGDNLFKALAKSGANQWVEVVSEHSGGLFDEIVSPLKNQILKVGIFKSFLASNPTAKATDFMKWVKRAGWNGVIEEMFEERIGEAARGVLTQLGLSEEGWKIPSKEQLAVELVSFSVPGVMIGASNRALQSGTGSIEEALKATSEGKTKPITIAENIIGARDMIMVGKGGTDLNADLMSKLQTQIEAYNNEMAQSVIDVSENNIKANIQVVQYPDGKWGYSYEIENPNTGIISDFLSNKLSNSKEAAIELAKQNASKEVQSLTPDESIAQEDIDNLVLKLKEGKEFDYEAGKERLKKSKEEEALNKKQVEKLNSAKTGEAIEIIGYAGMAEGAKDSGFRSVDKDIARSYGVDRNGNLNEFYDKIDNPFVAENQTAILRAWTDEGDTEAKSLLEEFQKWISEHKGTHNQDAIVIKIDAYIKEKLSKQGYDGVVYPPEKEYQIFDTSKSTKPEKKETQKEKVAEAVKEKPKTIKEISDEANTDWEENYAEKFGELADREVQIREELKTAKVAEKVGLQKELTDVQKKMGDIENEWIKKWQEKTGEVKKDFGTEMEGKIKSLVEKINKAVMENDTNFLISLRTMIESSKDEKLKNAAIEAMRRSADILKKVKENRITNKKEVSKISDKKVLSEKEQQQVNNLLNGADSADNPDVESIIQFHGTQQGDVLRKAISSGNIRPTNGLIGSGFYVTTDKELAEYFGKQLKQDNYRISTKNPVEVIPIDLRNLNIKTQPFGKGEYYEFLEKEKLTTEQYNDKLKSEGYDGLNLVGRGETVIWSVDKIKEYKIEKPEPRFAKPKIEKSEKAVEEFIKPRIEEAAKGVKNIPLNLVSKIFDLREKAIEEIDREMEPRKRGQLKPQETTFDKEIKSLNREFSNTIYKIYKERFGEYPIGFISLSDSPFEWKNEGEGKILFDVMQAETDPVETIIADNLDDIIGALQELKSRGRSSEIIQSDIQYEVERTRPQEKVEAITPKPRIAKSTQKPSKSMQPAEVASKIIPKRPYLPILGEFKVEGGKMVANDLEVAISLNTDLEDGMYKIIGKEAVKTETDPKEFPTLPKVEGKIEFSMLTDNIANELKAANLMIDKNNRHAEITGVLMKVENGRITFASTNSFTLYAKRVNGKITGEGEFILSNPDKVQKTIKSLGGKVDVVIGKELVKLIGSEGEMYVKKIDGKFPDFWQVFPAITKGYSIEKPAFLKALKELKPFTKKVIYEVGVEFKGETLKLTAQNEQGNKKEIELKTHGSFNVNIPAGTENDGVLVMPILTEDKEVHTYNINYLMDALNALENDAVYFYLGDNPQRTATLITNTRELETPKQKPDIKTIKKGTKLFHGTSKEAAQSIISDGINKTNDETATYGKAVYLTPDYKTAKDYADQEGEGEVLEIKSTKDLKLYQPTKAEREDLIDKVGEAQDELIEKMLGDKYDGFYIPDDGRGDGGEQVILYNDNAENFEKASIANEIKSDKVKTIKQKNKRAPSGIASAGADKLGNFEDISGVKNKTPEQLKIFERVKSLIEKYAKSIGENYLPRNALGVYYPETTNIRIKGMNNLSVAAHEITHFLDYAYKISDSLMGIKGYSINGRPIYESGTYKLRKEMSAVYEKYYPGANPNRKLKIRMEEGFATLLEKYIEQPTTIKAEFPNLVREFFEPGGKFYKPVMGDIIKDLKEIVAEYQGLAPLDKIGARIINDQVNVNKDSFLNFWQKLKTTVADNIYPIELLAKKTGTHFTTSDPSLWVRQYNNSNALILNNIKGHRGYWGWRNGELVKLHDYNWKDFVSELQSLKITDTFANWLVARKEYFDYQELKKLEEKGEIKEAQELSKVLRADGFTEQEVSEAYLENKDRFSEYAKKFDTLVREDLNFLHDPSVGLVDNEEFEKLTSKEGYATMKRYFYDELVGDEEKANLGRIRFGSAKVSSLIKRTGSQKPIINPLYSSIKNHSEITKKGMKQIVYNKIGALAEANPELGLFQRLQLQGVPDRKGRILFPQEKDPNVVMARLNYKRKPYLVDGTIKRTIDEVLNFQNITIFEKILLGGSRFFTKGTTGLFPGFALTNYTVDQITASAQTRNKYKVIYDPLKNLYNALQSDNPQHIYLLEYLVMGGERQTFVGWQDMTPNELFTAIKGEKQGILKVIDAVNKGMDILAIPSQWSEIMTRATEYIKARQEGKPQIVALEEAARVTAPFSHIGRWGGGRIGQVYVKSIPFFNPGIQVLAQAAETLETPEGRRRYAFVSLAVVAASIASFGLIMATGSDDQKRLYADISPDELNKYIWLPSPDRKTLIKIRVPDQMNFTATLTNMILADAKLGANYTAGEYLQASTSWLPQQFDVSQPVKMAMSWIPQIIKPGVLTIAGVKDFPKIIPLESQMLQNRAPEFRYNEATSPVAKWLGKAFGLSPIKIDYLITGYFGRATGFLTGKPGIYNPFKAMNREYYFTSGRTIQSFYERKEKNDQEYEAYRNGRQDFKLGERSAILKERARLKPITDLIGLYRDIDEEKYPEKSKKLRDKIIKLINEL